MIFVFIFVVVFFIVKLILCVYNLFLANDRRFDVQ
jgi:hypothetical protein